MSVFQPLKVLQMSVGGIGACRHLGRRPYVGHAHVRRIRVHSDPEAVGTSGAVRSMWFWPMVTPVLGTLGVSKVSVATATPRSVPFPVIVSLDNVTFLAPYISTAVPSFAPLPKPLP